MAETFCVLTTAHQRSHPSMLLLTFTCLGPCHKPIVARHSALSTNEREGLCNTLWACDDYIFLLSRYSLLSIFNKSLNVKFTFSENPPLYYIQQQHQPTRIPARAASLSVYSLLYMHAATLPRLRKLRGHW